MSLFRLIICNSLQSSRCTNKIIVNYLNLWIAPVAAFNSDFVFHYFYQISKSSESDSVCRAVLAAGPVFVVGLRFGSTMTQIGFAIHFYSFDYSNYFCKSVVETCFGCSVNIILRFVANLVATFVCI